MRENHVLVIEWHNDDVRPWAEADCYDRRGTMDLRDVHWGATGPTVDRCVDGWMEHIAGHDDDEPTRWRPVG